MTRIAFTGFGGVRIEGDERGASSDPAVLLVHGAGQTKRVWDGAAQALADAGRRAISIDLRGHGASEWPADGRYAFDCFVADLRAVLAQLDVRPVIVGAGLGAWAAMAALERDAATLAAGLVLVDLPDVGFGDGAPPNAQAADRDARLAGAVDLEDAAAQFERAAPSISLPVIVARGGLAGAVPPPDWIARLPDCEFAEIEEAGRLVAASAIEGFNALLLDFLERRLPRVVPDYRSGSDARTLRDALGCFATGVTVVTTITDSGDPVGLTANSFTSVSLDPPLLLVCIADSASCANAFRTAEHFTINVLQIGQQRVSTRFATRDEDKFAATLWAPGETGSPVLADSLSAFECARHALHDGGDHFILVGRVVRATFEPRRDPLLYFRGKYRRLHFA